MMSHLLMTKHSLCQKPVRMLEPVGYRKWDRQRCEMLGLRKCKGRRPAAAEVRLHGQPGDLTSLLDML